MKKYRSAIILTALLAVLVAVAYWDEWQTKRDDAAKASENLAFSIKSEDLIRIVHVEAASGERIELVKDGASWKIKSPFEAAADVDAVNSFIKTMLEYKSEKRVSDAKEKWGDFGLSSPQRSISLTDSAGKTETLHVGSQAPVGYSAFFRMGDEGAVFVGSQYIITSTGKTAREFRDKSIGRIESSDIAQLNYYVGGELILSAAQNDGKFVVTKPEAIDGDHSEIIGFIGELNSAKAEEFNDNPDAEFLKAFKSSKAGLAVGWSTKSGEQHEWTVAAVNDDFWVKPDSSATYFKISTDTLKGLKKELKHFRNRQIADFEVVDVAKVEIDGKVFDKKEEGFVAAGTSESVPHVQNLVSDFAWTKADDFVAAGSKDAKVVESAARHKIAFEFLPTKNKPRMEVEGWESVESPGKFVLRVSGAKSLLLVGKTLFDNTKPATVAPAEMPVGESESDSGI